MNIQNDYSELLGYAGKAIHYKKLIDCDPAELVNNAFIAFFESGEEYFIQNIKKSIDKYAWQKAIEQKSTKEYIDDFAPKSKRSFHCYNSLERTCKKCKEQKPSMCFRLMSIGQYKHSCNICKDCMNKATVEWFKDNSKRWADYMNQWREKKGKKKNKVARPIHELWNEANARYNQKQKELLTDVYIKKLLRGKEITPQTIEAKRSELLAKRKTAETNKLI